MCAVLCIDKVECNKARLRVGKQKPHPVVYKSYSIEPQRIFLRIKSLDLPHQSVFGSHTFFESFNGKVDMVDQCKIDVLAQLQIFNIYSIGYNIISQYQPFHRYIGNHILKLQKSFIFFYAKHLFNFRL